MGSLLLRRNHGHQAPARTSARLEAALRGGESIPADWVSLVVVKSGTRASWHLVDSEAVSSAALDPASSPFVLRDRDRELKMLNDRLLIMKVIPSNLKDPSVHRLCLAAAVVPEETERLRLPAESARQ